jgi:cardiolipin synthase
MSQLTWILIDLAIFLLVAGHVLMHKREPRNASFWLLLVFFLPFAGFVLYWLLGVNRVKRKARRRSWAAGPGAKGTAHPAPTSLAALRRAGDHICQYPATGGNRISPLANGDQAYPAMLTAIRGAKRSLALLTYIFDNDGIGRVFCRELVLAAKRGVKVRVLVDGIGAWGLGRQLHRDLEACHHGRMTAFWPKGRFLKNPGINLRIHRKILVADGRLGFTGSINISDRHLSQNGRDPVSRDLHFKVEGPVVAHLADTFARDWELADKERLTGDDWFPKLKPVGPLVARGVPSGPDQDLEKVYELLLAGLRSAKKSVDLVTPYFIPDFTILAALRAASFAGVKVRILMPRHSDFAFLRWAARAYLWELLEAGVEILEVEGGFVHSKLMVVDGNWAMLGSANLDPRSFRLNFEFNLAVEGVELPGKLKPYVDYLAAGALHVTQAGLRREPLPSRLRNMAFKLFSPYL